VVGVDPDSSEVSDPPDEQPVTISIVAKAEARTRRSFDSLAFSKSAMLSPLSGLVHGIVPTL
jgi:hypothetical protein